MKRRLSLAILALICLGVTTSTATAATSEMSLDEVLYWTGDAHCAGPDSLNTVDSNQPQLYGAICVEDVYLNGRKLEYRFSPESGGRVYVTGSGTGFSCWAPSPPEFNIQKIQSRNMCHYSSFSAFITPMALMAESSPHLTFAVRRLPGVNPRGDIGFLKSSGEIHTFIPSSSTRRVATIEISPASIHGGSGSFSTAVQDIELPLYSPPPQLTYGFFVATRMVTGAYGGYGFEVLPESNGSWIATDAAHWGFYGDYTKVGGYSIRVAGPHFKHKADPGDPDELVMAEYKTFMPTALVQRILGISPSEASEATVSVTRSIGLTPTQLPSTFTVVPDGLIIETDGITFSSPVVSVSPRIVLNLNQKISLSRIKNAAGIPRAFRGSARIRGEVCGASQCVVKNGRVSFSKPGKYRVRVSYIGRDTRKQATLVVQQVVVEVR